MERSRLAAVLLVDDVHADNFVHRRVIEQVGGIGSVHACLDAQTALAHLEQGLAGEHPIPNLVLLDVNMPGMSGWDFLEAFEQIAPERREGIVVVLLTTSDDPADRRRSQEFSSVRGYRTKPLTVEMFRDLAAEFF